ncbi:hypothetical protein D3C78_743050 [compost metagenome]
MGNALPMQVRSSRGDACGNVQRHGSTQAQVVGVHVTAARGQAGQVGQVAVARVDQVHHQPGLGLGMVDEAPMDANQVRMNAGGDAGVHFMQR